MKIAIQGIAGAFHEEAARLRFSHEPIEIVPCLTFRELAAAVASGLADKGIMAIENTISGTIQHNLELIREQQLWISDEVIMRIRQHLGGVPGSSLQSIRKVYSHYMALNQCRPFFEAYPEVELIESEDTALSIRDVAIAGSTEMAAIGSALAIARNGLIVLGKEIEASKQNYTRFLILDRLPQTPTACNKASISLVLKSDPEAFTQAMALLHNWNIHLAKIESMTIPGQPWHYRYYLDLRSESEGQLAELLADIESLAVSIQLLGKYTAHTL
ncbi:prephenate dehydratase [Pontibacter lucknowensis]|uniref:prephenate dehydratase n=1 Tax=Pontibacter lucknowensis TaxID=1077936 RepID=A0A1N6Y2I6_9BACT|nr:prephenate dehydratase domain-containing protein [Pontibacter lucknowensis]SIR08780.1 prephenate dehydratase [Pontibacter lucknowensis]